MKTSKSKKKSEVTEEQVDAVVDPNEKFDETELSELEKLEDGFKSLSGRVRAFKTIGDEVRGVFINRTPVKKKNMSDILTFTNSEGADIQCWSSAGIDQSFEKAGIEPDGKFEIIIRYLGKQSIGGRKTFKQFNIQSREV